MADQSKTFQELIAENAALKTRIRELEAMEAEHKRAWEAIRESEEHFKTMIEQSPYSIEIYDLDGFQISANKAYEDLWGFSASTTLKKFNVLESKEIERLELLSYVERAYAGEVVTVPGYAFDPAHVPLTGGVGRIRWLHTKIYPLKDPFGKVTNIVVLHEDITKRKRAEEALRESEARYRLIAENTADLISIMDMNLRFTYISPATMRLRGFTVEEAMEQTLDQVLTPESMQLSLTVFEEEMRLEASGTADPDRIRILELEEYKKDGSIIWVEVSLSFLRDKDHKPSEILIVTRDITERKRIEEALSVSESQHRNIFNNSIEGIFQTTPDGRYRNINPAFASMFGYESPDEMKSAVTNIGEQLYIDPADRESLIDMIHRSQGAVREFVAQVKRKDGSVLWVSINARMVNDEHEKSSYLEGTCMDITHRKQTEKEIGMIRDRLSRAEIISRTGNWEFDLESNLVFASAGARNIYGLHNAEWTIPEVQEIPLPEYRDMLDSALQALIKGNRPYDVEFKIRHPETDEIVDIHSVAEYDQNRKVVFGIIQDISERKQAEEERRELAERLKRAEKMEALGTLAGGVAHDLNNVLGVVSGYAELLLMEVNESSPVRPRLIRIIEGGQRAAAIVQDLLTLARRGVTGRGVINLNEIIADCLQSLEFEKLSSYHSSVRIKSDLEPDLLNISGSSVHLGKTLFNLVSNANEAMPTGGTVTIKTANQYIDQPIHGYDEVREGDYVVLSVSDTGSGIAEADLKRIFEPFYTKKVMGRSGTGLGLAVVWGTVKDHNGYINVESKEGKGSTFMLYFPVTRGKISSETLAISISDYMGNGESILVVDDVKGQRDLAAEMLQKLNYSVASVSSGEEALAYLKDHTIDLVVLDMIMDPGMDGLDTYRSIIEINPGQKAIIVSGFSETHRVDAVQALGAGAYIRKPYVIEKLGLAVKKELDRK